MRTVSGTDAQLTRKAGEKHSDMDDLIFFAPVKKQTIWGGDSLAAQYGFDTPGTPIAEAWTVSAHPSGDCVAVGGTWDGVSLSRLWKEQPQLFACPWEQQFPLLIKFIDAARPLSVQVHPDDAYAAAHETTADGSRCRGKSECWYVVSAQPGATLVLGHTAATRQEAVRLIEEDRWDELLRTVPVRAGDFFRIDPGTVHAIGAGIIILETQQSSDVTYRLYDYGRLQNGRPRPLHLRQSLDVMTVPACETAERPQLMPTAPQRGTATLTRLEKCDYFSVYKLDLDGALTLPGPVGFVAVTVLEGTGTVNGCPVKKGQSFVVPHPVEQVVCDGCFTAVFSQPEQPRTF